ncbi:hypothetical protein [Thomasclavelia ramosa]|uniref:hypothetical protein n=1 Tax=Thomasclavelia ramosa TaxID=1547 RepID=UPI0035672080
MRVFNEDKTQELKEYDLNKGHLKLDKLFIRHHEAVEEIKEQWHYETIAEYPNGGKDVSKVIDVPYQASQEAFDEYEDIYVYIPYTYEELEELNKPSELEILKREQEVTAQAVQDLILMTLGGN